MQQSIFIKFDTALPDQAEWIILPRSGSQTEVLDLHNGSLDEAAKDCRNRHIILVIPANEVTLTEAEIPTHNRQRVLKALPYSLEENLINDVDTQHFAIHLNKTGHRHPVAVIDKTTLEKRLVQFQESCPVQPQSAIPDTLLIPNLKDWNLIIHGDQCLLRSGRFSGFQCSIAQLTQYLELALNYQPDNKPSKIACWTQTDTITDDIKAFSNKHNIELSIENSSVEPLQLFAQYYNEEQTINLLQGAYAYKSRADHQWQKWYPAAAALLLWLVTLLAANIAHYFEMKHQISALQQEAIVLYKSTSPSTRKFTRLRKRMAKKLASLQKQQGVSHFDFLKLLGATGNVIKNVKEFKLTNIKFENSKLSIYFVIDDTGKLDTIEKSLRKTGFNIIRGPANRSQQGYTSNLIISGKRS